MDYFFVSTMGFAFGVLLYSLGTFGWPAIGFAAFLGSAFALLHFFYERSPLFLVSALMLVATAMGAGRTMLAPTALPLSFMPSIGTNIDWEGIIAADPDIRESNQHVTIKVEKGGVETRVLAFAPLSPKLSYGERVEVSGTLELPKPFATDGGRTFDYAKFLAKDGVFATVPQAFVKIKAPPAGFGRLVAGLYGVKQAFARALERALPEPAAALAEGLLTGGKQGLGDALLAAFTVTGIVQIVVLSGYNVMVVADGILAACAVLPRRLSLLLAGAGVSGFVLIAGAGSSALRAGLMACLALFAQATGRRYDALRGLALALTVMLLYNPLSLAYDPGFELSFAATLGLIVGTPLLVVRLAWIRNAFLRDIAATTLAAQIAVLPLLLWQTGNLSFVSVPANILVSAAVPGAMAAAFFAGMASIVVPPLAPLAGIPAYLLLSFIIAVARYGAALPFAAVTLPAFPFLLVVVAYLGLAVLVKRLSRPTPSLSGSVPRTRPS